MGLLTNAGPPPWHPATAPLRVGGSFYLSLFWVGFDHAAHRSC